MLSIFISLAMEESRGEEKKSLLIKSRSAFPGISWGNVTLPAFLQPCHGAEGDKAANGPWRSGMELWEGGGEAELWRK